VNRELLCEDCGDCWSAILYSNKMKLHCFQLANNLNRILTFYYYFISMHTMPESCRAKDHKMWSDCVWVLGLGLGFGVCVRRAQKSFICGCQGKWWWTGLRQEYFL